MFAKLNFGRSYRRYAWLAGVERFFLEDDATSSLSLEVVKKGSSSWLAVGRTRETPLRSSPRTKFHRTQLFYEKTHTEPKQKHEKSRLKQNTHTRWYTQVANNKSHTDRVKKARTTAVLHVFDRFFPLFLTDRDRANAHTWQSAAPIHKSNNLSGVYS